jgi:phage-related protein
LDGARIDAQRIAAKARIAALRSELAAHEVVEDLRGDAYRAVYTVRFAGWIYVLHCFQKKSKSGIKTPKTDLDLINARLKAAKLDYEAWLATQGARQWADIPRSP